MMLFEQSETSRLKNLQADITKLSYKQHQKDHFTLSGPLQNQALTTFRNVSENSFSDLFIVTGQDSARSFSAFTSTLLSLTKIPY